MSFPVTILAGGTISLPHHDHHPRRYELFGGTKITDFTYRERGVTIGNSSSSNYLSGMVLSMTHHPYYNSQVPDVTAARIKFEHNNSSDWDIVDFSWFSGLSAHDIINYLDFAGGIISITEPLTSNDSYFQAIGFCTYNGSLTASDGSFYCAGLTRCNKPVWLETAAQVGLFGAETGYSYYDNYMVCTSGNNLILPYLTYREKLSAEY